MPAQVSCAGPVYLEKCYKVRLRHQTIGQYTDVHWLSHAHNQAWQQRGKAGQAWLMQGLGGEAEWDRGGRWGKSRMRQKDGQTGRRIRPGWGLVPRSDTGQILTPISGLVSPNWTAQICTTDFGSADPSSPICHCVLPGGRGLDSPVSRMQPVPAPGWVWGRPVGLLREKIAL